MAQEMIMLSACLAGVNCVYDGTNKAHPVFCGLKRRGKTVLFCPEVLGGLKIPHDPSEILGGDGCDVWEGRARVVSKSGRDVSSFFMEGAMKALGLARRHKITKAVMKSKSPSCGCGLIFDGTFSKKLIFGYGVTAALLKKSGIDVVSDAEYLGKKTKLDRGEASLKAIKAKPHSRLI
jgi:uncharacterized protein YbbK (DUF523 family)